MSSSSTVPAKRLNAGALVNKCLGYYRRAEPEVRDAGRVWFPVANAFVRYLASKYHLSERSVAGVVAVLSPKVRWTSQVGGQVEKVITHWLAHKLPPQDIPGYYGNTVKAYRVLDGWDSMVKGPKVTAFRDNLLLNDSEITIDTWMIRAILGWEVNIKISEARSRWLARIVRMAAKKVGEAPAHMQAIIWMQVQLENPNVKAPPEPQGYIEAWPGTESLP